MAGGKFESYQPFPGSENLDYTGVNPHLIPLIKELLDERSEPRRYIRKDIKSFTTPEEELAIRSRNLTKYANRVIEWATGRYKTLDNDDHTQKRVLRDYGSSLMFSFILKDFFSKFSHYEVLAAETNLDFADGNGFSPNFVVGKRNPDETFGCLLGIRTTLGRVNTNGVKDNPLPEVATNFLINAPVISLPFPGPKGAIDQFQSTTDPSTFLSEISGNPYIEYNLMESIIRQQHLLYDYFLGKYKRGSGEPVNPYGKKFELIREFVSGLKASETYMNQTQLIEP